jgi:hypothetical protein
MRDAAAVDRDGTSEATMDTRRSFLAKLGVGAASGALSAWVPVLEAEAQAARVPKRLVMFITPGGTLHDRLIPTGATPSQLLMPLARHWPRVTVCAQGINQRVFSSGGPGDDHQRAVTQLLTARRLTGTSQLSSGGVSIDHHIAATIGADRLFRVLHLGVGRAAPHSYLAANTPLNAEVSPAAALGRIFAGVTGSGGPSARDQQRLRVLAMVRGQLAQVRRRVGAADQMRIDAHADGLDELQTRINAASRLTCARPALAGAGDYEHALDQHAELVTAGFACDLARVAVISVGSGGDVGQTFPWLGVADDHHELSHAAANRDAAAMDKITRIHVWYAARVAALLDRLAARALADGSTLLDHTMVLWLSSLAQGNHRVENLPVVVANGGGMIRGGRVLRLAGRSHSDFLVTLARAFGL